MAAMPTSLCHVCHESLPSSSDRLPNSLEASALLQIWKPAETLFLDICVFHLRPRYKVCRFSFCDDVTSCSRFIFSSLHNTNVTN